MDKIEGIIYSILIICITIAFIFIIQYESKRLDHIDKYNLNKEKHIKLLQTTNN